MVLKCCDTDYVCYEDDAKYVLNFFRRDISSIKIGAKLVKCWWKLAEEVIVGERSYKVIKSSMKIGIKSLNYIIVLSEVLLRLLWDG